MPEPGVHLETVKTPSLYTPKQIEDAIRLVALLARGRFILTVPPEGHGE